MERCINRGIYLYNQASQLASIDDSRRGRTQYLYDAPDRLTRGKGALQESLIHNPAHILPVAETGEAANTTSTSPRHW